MIAALIMDNKTHSRYSRRNFKNLSARGSSSVPKDTSRCPALASQNLSATFLNQINSRRRLDRSSLSLVRTSFNRLLSIFHLGSSQCRPKGRAHALISKEVQSRLVHRHYHQRPTVTNSVEPSKISRLGRPRAAP